MNHKHGIDPVKFPEPEEFLLPAKELDLSVSKERAPVFQLNRFLCGNSFEKKSRSRRG